MVPARWSPYDHISHRYMGGSARGRKRRQRTRGEYEKTSISSERTRNELIRNHVSAHPSFAVDWGLCEGDSGITRTRGLPVASPHASEIRLPSFGKS